MDFIWIIDMSISSFVQTEAHFKINLSDLKYTEEGEKCLIQLHWNDILIIQVMKQKNDDLKKLFMDFSF